MNLRPVASVAHFSIIYNHRFDVLNLALLPTNLKTLHVQFDDHDHSIPVSLEDFARGKFCSLRESPETVLKVRIRE